MTAPAQQPQSDAPVHTVELVISNLLRIGVLSSLLIVLAGTVLTFTRHTNYLSSPDALKSLLSKSDAFPHSMAEVGAGLLALQGRSIVILGLLLLIATPVARVGVSIFAFLYQKDRTFALITTIVFLLLLLSFFLGKVEG